jgi:beta-mannosidase
MRMELGGDWIAVEADDEVRRFGIGLDPGSTDEWTPVDVPGHWQSSEKFAASDGPIMYRREYSLEPPVDGARRFVTVDGVFYQSDLWLDGAYLGDTEGYFFPHTFDVTALSRLGSEHVLAIEVACPREPGSGGRRLLTGSFQDADVVGRANPGGLWRPVHVYDTGPVRIAALRVLVRDADSRRAHLMCAARLDSDEQRTVTVRTLIDGELHREHELVIASGVNDLEWTIDIADPVLWWPRSIGPQALTVVEVEVVVDTRTSDRRRRRTGLRQVTWANWICSVNGERIFLKGVNLGPSSPTPADVAPDELRADVALAVELGLDAIRVNGHVADRALYDAADDAGLLILQDFPLSGPYARSVRRGAVEQARALVDTLGHHPSIVSWCAHDEPSTPEHDREGGGFAHGARRLIAAQLPSWNRSVLDRWVKRALERTDPTRPTVAHSGVAPHLPLLDGTDSHLWYGWRHGSPEDLAKLAARFPRRVRFVSEFGAESVPLGLADAPALRAQDLRGNWPDLDWDRIDEAHGYDRDTFETLFPPAAFPTFDEWANASQLYQAHLLKVQIETLRRLKYRPTGGFCFASLVDAAPLISTSVVDHERVSKLAADAVRSACSPVVVIADALPAYVAPGNRLDADVHVVSDRRAGIDFAVVDVAATWPGGRSDWRFGGPIPADDVVKVGTVQLQVPNVYGALVLSITLSAGEITSTNTQTSLITVPS